MKIIHCADIHADSKMGTHFSKEQAEKRRNEVVDTFANMVKYAQVNDVKVILIAGDFFDTKETQQKKIKQRIGYIIEQNSSIDFLYLRGNHDEDTSFLADKELSNLKYFSKSSWTKYSYDNIDIYGHEFSDKIPAGSFNELVPDPNHINIVTLHGQVADYQSKKDAPDISLLKLANKNIDYVALGHIHDFKKEKLDARGYWCYSGCLEGRGFDECGEKGFVLLEINNNKLNAEFIPISKRTIHDIQVELSGSLSYNEIMKKIDESVADIPQSDIVQVTLSGEVTEETEIEPDSYVSTIENNFFYVRIKDKTELKIDYEKYKNDISLKGEFIRLVNQNNGLSDEEKAKVIMTGIKALAGRLN